MGSPLATGHSDHEAAHVIADAGTSIELGAIADSTQPLAAVVSRLGSLRHAGARTALWIQLRGCTRIDASEGRFTLRQSMWMVFDPESRQELQAMRNGMTVGLLLPRASMAPEGLLFPGSGRARRAEIRIALNLWRRRASQTRLGAAVAAKEAAPATWPLLLHLQHLQSDLHRLVARCPGRTTARKHQVLARMQRVRMMLEGNTHRQVRLAELAELGRFSEWWVSKTFHAIYAETVQEASIRLRMQRACELLENTSLSIGELGEACGFHDPCSFARLFKSRHGQTASRWREDRRLGGQGLPPRWQGSPAVAALDGAAGQPCSTSR
ncbi:helix-turn-helix transcriptional regulator [Luteimonas sp. SJ-92]|uniref:Helix-turn-helix transcriptional regulator n=1 Tax=Luteimonas salinisoli TaxID=2752307 RepID=A0A853J7R0_9GAMM|nr:AraC family transcriptional regulator [Luteimonas salinisoli]NZA24784.1 helix-turn-helix transcriptional regulator [Luteimonas salinisoli]